ncbi:MAG: response receiver sensor protein serine/threonine phosphatase, family [Acidobacteria bacterium]|nr:response receiver sensor protein serine/threonine phosphatase, family [Acidobacteriota bacterium]
MTPKKRKPFTSAAVVAALLGPLAGIAVERAVRRVDDHRAAERFSRRVAERALALESEVADGRRTVVAAAALLSTSAATTGSEFARFAVELMARGSALQALSWAPVVPLGERERHEAEARRDAGRGYRIREQTESGALVSAARRDRYVPVRFVEPAAGNEAAVGFDLGSEPVRLSMLSRSTETGRAEISGLVRLVQESGESTGFLVAVPVYRFAADEKARRLAGFATGVFRVEDLIAAAFQRRGVGELQDMVVELVDHTGRSSGAVPSPGLPREVEPRDVTAVVRRPINLEGLPWTVIARPTPAYLAREAHSRAAAIGVGVFLGYELLLALALTARRWWLERTRREQAEFARSVIHSVAEGVMVADASGQLTIVNEAARRVLGRGSLSLPRARWSEAFGLFVPGTDRHFPADELPLPRAMGGEHVPETEVFVRNPQVPQGLLASVTGSPLKDVAGRLIGGVVVFRDITDAKRAQELSQQLSSAVEQAADSVFITDRAGVIGYVNPAFEATTGYSREEAVGRTPAILRSGLQPPEYYASLWATITGGEPFKGTVINRKRSGEHFYAEQTITPMKDVSTGEITHFVSVMRDMTERIKLRERDIEMRLGSSVQQRLFPQSSPVVSGYDIAGAVAPASATCGDYYDFIPLPDGRLALCIADVSGHGVGSALIMTATRAYLRSLTSTLTSLERLAGELNRLLYADLEEQRFVTMVLAVLERATGNLTWANFGHPTGYVLGRSGEVRAELKSGCRPLGLFQDFVCAKGPAVALAPGDTLVLLTDGLLEAQSSARNEFGVTAVLDVVRSALDRSADEIAGRLIAAAQSFAGGRQQDDDLTVVVCKRLLDD